MVALVRGRRRRRTRPGPRRLGFAPQNVAQAKWGTRLGAAMNKQAWVKVGWGIAIALLAVLVLLHLLGILPRPGHG